MDTKELTNDMIEKAYNALYPTDKAIIDALVAMLINNIKEKRVGKRAIMFGEKQALEVLAKLGILFIDRQVVSLGKE